MLSLATSRGSSVPSAVDQLGTRHDNIQSGTTTCRLFFFYHVLKPDSSLLLISPDGFAEDLALQILNVHGIILQTDTPHQGPVIRTSNREDEPGSHLADVLQKVQGLFEVVLVGSSVVVTDVQL